MNNTGQKRILLVGATGRVGRMVLHYWPQTGPDTICVAQTRAGRVPGTVHWHPMDGPAELLASIDAIGSFDVMVMLAGVTPTSGAPLELNTGLAQACLSAALQAGIGRVLLASSSAVYGAGHGMSFTEHSPCHPINAYGHAKLQMEHACAPWRQQGLDLCYLRIGNVAGADALLLNAARAGTGQSIPIDTYADGHGPIRSYLGPLTLASVLRTLCMIPDPLPDILNIAAPEPVSMDALARAADQPWYSRVAAHDVPQSITLDCAALARIHRFDPQDSDPGEMVRQWKGTLQR